jgi:protein SCO1/2
MIALVFAAIAALSGVRVDEHVGDRVPPDLVFSSSDGHHVTLGSQFDGARPVLLMMTYVRCKMLCSLVLRGTLEAVRAMSIQPGRDYRVVLVSIDPTEDAAAAAARIRDIGDRLGDATGWTYLTGTDSQIHALADALGFRYTFDARTDQYAHPAVVFVMTPDGRIARYLHGVQFEPRLVQRALQDAARGAVSTDAPAESILSCFLFDPAARAHRELVERYLRVGGLAVMLGLASLIGSLVVIDVRRRRRA